MACPEILDDTRTQIYLNIHPLLVSFIDPFDLIHVFIFSRDNDCDEVKMMECQHLIKFFDSTLEGRLHYTE